MHFDDASISQLQQITLWEECPNEFKYAAARELQLRMWKESYLTDLVVLWGKGFTAFQIGIELGIDEWLVKKKLFKHGLYKGRVTV